MSVHPSMAPSSWPSTVIAFVPSIESVPYEERPRRADPWWGPLPSPGEERAMCHSCVPLTTNVTSMLPRVALEYGQT
jgi:hypothetical protein